VKIALLTYSTQPRGGVVHMLALAEALVAAGASVTVWTLGRVRRYTRRTGRGSAAGG
jgi:hypothetical protein